MSKEKEQYKLQKDLLPSSSSLPPRAWPKRTSLVLELSSRLSVRAQLLLPPDLDRTEVTKYPLVVLLPNQPNAHQVTETWGADLGTLLSSRLKMAVIKVDGRGSEGRGLRWRDSLDIGNTDVDDQLQAVREVLAGHSFLDSTRVAVIGTNYGGFLAALMLADRDLGRLLHCGVLTSPIFDWRYLDPMTAERNLGSPNSSSNYPAYEAASLSGIARRLTGKELLLVHGAKDSIVPISQSMALARELTMQNLLFRQQIYAGEGNTLEGVTEHYLNTVTAFLENCFHNDRYAEAL